MAIQPKSTIKPLFVDGATPNGTAFGDWIDSCAFLNTDSSSTLTSLRMPVSTNPASAPSGYKTLFFSSANSNNLYAINSSGVISAIAGTKYIVMTLSNFMFNTTDGPNVMLLSTKKKIKILSIRGVQTGPYPGGTIAISKWDIGLNTSAIISSITAWGSSFLSLFETIFPITNAIVEVDKTIVVEFQTGSGWTPTDAYMGSLTIEYEEVN